MKKNKELEIHNNWLNRFSWLYEDEIECVVCGAKKHLEKCHLIPNSLGGDNTPDNLIMLCHEHHRQAPNTCIDKEIMLIWAEREAQKYTKTRGMNMTNDMLDRYSDIGVKFLRAVIEGLSFKVDEFEIVKEIMDFLSDKCAIVSSHSKYNYKETILNTMEFLYNNKEKLNKFIKEFEDHKKEMAKEDIIHINEKEINLKHLNKEVCGFLREIKLELGDNDRTYAEVYGHFITEKNKKNQPSSISYNLIVSIYNENYCDGYYKMVSLDEMNIEEDEEIWEVINKIGSKMKNHKLTVWKYLNDKNELVKLGKDCIE